MVGVLRSVLLVLAVVLVSVGAGERSAAERERKRKEATTAASRRLLAAHQVRPDVQRELASMASTMTKSDVARHAASHFPKKSLAEVNSIVAASAIAAGRPLPKNSATQTAEARLRAHKSRQFEEAKKKLSQSKRR